MNRRSTIVLALCVAACGSSPDQGDGGPSPDGGDGGAQGDASPGNDSGTDSSSGGGKVIFVIPLENHSQGSIYGNTTEAPYINNTLLKDYPHTTNFTDELPSLNSEPHYVWMEAGTNKFTDHTFTTDNDSSSSNCTNSAAHLVTQLQAANVSWTSYQEGMTAGTCPISSITGTFYAAKHNPFVFFEDVVGTPPDPKNAGCIAHHKPFSALAADLKGTVSQYNFVTPDLCNDMHGDPACPSGSPITAGDNWLKANLQPMIDYALAHNGYVFITFDEGDKVTLQIPFIAIGQHSIAGKVGTVAYTHSSMLKSEEEILGVSVLASVTSANDFADLFDQGTFP